MPILSTWALWVFEKFCVKKSVKKHARPLAKRVRTEYNNRKGKGWRCAGQAAQYSGTCWLRSTAISDPHGITDPMLKLSAFLDEGVEKQYISQAAYGKILR